MAALTLSNAALAAGARDHIVALDGAAFSANAGKSVVSARDAIFHHDTTLDFGDKTLGTAMPGDVVTVDGEEQVLTGIDHRVLGAAFALDAKTLAAQAGETRFTVAGAVDHAPLKVELLGKTVGALQPGDEILVDGEPHILRGIERSETGTLYLTGLKGADAEAAAEQGYIAGFGLIIAAIFKFKQHKINPQQ